MNIPSLTLISALALCLAPTGPQASPYSPAVDTGYPKAVYFGDLHLHSNLSADAFSMGNLLLDPADAFRFARGQEVRSSSGLRAQLKRPLDFLAVTDHAEFLGIYRAYELGLPELKEGSLGRVWQAAEKNKGTYHAAFPDSINDPDADRDSYPEGIKKSIWTTVTRTADDFNDPGIFTTFSGYEWTSMVGGSNLHRCVIFRDESELTARVLPFSAQQSRDPEDLWQALQHYEDLTGGEALAIPHNGNLSSGLMWDLERLDGEPITENYARTRMRWEPIAEVTQIKGDSETHPLLSPNDEFADFERWDKYNIMNTAPLTPEMFPGSYARYALGRGMQLEQALGVNPYQFGMIGSTDDHTSLATAAEDNFFGKFANSEPGVRRPDSFMAGALVADWELGASGLTAVWARENTRQALFESMKRREVYATTGSRIVLRFFGGWGYPSGSAHSPDFEKIAYAGGVPMGGELFAEKQREAPTFLVWATKDPDGANLDQIQIIKGWLDAAGEFREKIFYAALSDGRAVDPTTGKPTAVGSTVDLDTVTYKNTIGAAELVAQWTDPEFDADQRAFYYARVLEIPKPRWTEYDRKHYGFKVPEEVPATIQDRAYSSPIWYKP